MKKIRIAKGLLDLIYHRFPKQHKRLMQDKYYFWYRHTCWNHGGLKQLIEHQEQLGGYLRGEKGLWKI